MENNTLPPSSYPICPKCGCDKPKIFVHGHYQCEDCKCVADGDCCQGEVAQGSQDAHS